MGWHTCNFCTLFVTFSIQDGPLVQANLSNSRRLVTCDRALRTVQKVGQVGLLSCPPQNMNCSWHHDTTVQFMFAIYTQLF